MEELKKQLDKLTLILEEQQSLKINLSEVRQAWLEMNEVMKRIEHVQLNHQQILDLITLEYLEHHISKIKVQSPPN